MRNSVLVVEDEPQVARLLTRLFEHQGWHVRSAATLAEARGNLDPPPTWVTLDLMLPDARGEELIRDVRQRKLATRIAVLTGTLDPQRLRAAEELQPDLIFKKPVQFGDLFGKMTAAAA